MVDLLVIENYFLFNTVHARCLCLIDEIVLNFTDLTY